MGSRYYISTPVTIVLAQISSSFVLIQEYDFLIFENRVLFSYMTKKALHLFLLNKDVYLENVSSMITQSHQIFTVHQVRQ